MPRHSTNGETIIADLLQGYLREGRVFSVTTNFNTISGNAETPYILLTNPVSSGRLALIYSISFGIDSATSRSILRAYAAPTITSNGTGLTIANNFVGSSITSVCNAYVSPTISSNGTLAGPFQKGAGTDGTIIYREFILSQGTSMLGTVQNSIPNTSTYVNITWMDIPV